MSSLSVTMTGAQWIQLSAHLFPGDLDEHAAVLRCGVVTTPSGTRLLVRDVSFARDGIDYVPGTRGYRMLTADFVLRNINLCDKDRLAYIAVHCHGGRTSVAFSGDDMASHERGYPALLEITRGMPVGALVFASEAAAGDIWFPDGSRRAVDHLNVAGRQRVRMRDVPAAAASAAERYDRQSRMFGDSGQAILEGQTVAIIGAGGGGSLLCEYAARLGVGSLLLVDPDRVETSNLSRIVGSRRRDARPWLTDNRRPKWLRSIGERLQTPKVEVASRVARAANPKVQITRVRGRVEDPEVARLLLDCDHIFLAADSAVARHVVNAVSHQYLIPFTQIGAKVTVLADGTLSDVFSVSRTCLPGDGCLWCNGLVSPERLRLESTPGEILARQRYVDDVDVPSPSVITLNAVAAAMAINEWLIGTVGLTRGDAGSSWMFSDARTSEVSQEIPRRDADCRECGPRRFARGDGVPLPLRLG